MTPEAPPFEIHHQEIMERVIEKWQSDYILRLPRLMVSDETKIWDVMSCEQLSDELYSRGLKKGQVAAVTRVLGVVGKYTVGELKNMTDKEILESEDFWGSIRERSLLIIRMLFGHEESGNIETE